MTLTVTGSLTGTPTIKHDFGRATALSCRECGQDYPLGDRYVCEECFGPLEVTYSIGSLTRAEIEAGPRSIWRYRALLPVPDDVASAPGLAPGCTRLVRADNLGRALGLRVALPGRERSRCAGADRALQRDPLAADQLQIAQRED